jgi:ABC-type nickel/cobalt efflux system permease component RcnA
MHPILLYGTAFVLGSVHALEPDHVSAVTAFATSTPKRGRAVRFGLQWAVGHAAAVIVIGTVLILFQRDFPTSLTEGLERVVGAALMGLGVWTIWNARALHAHPHTHQDGTLHVHVHSHARSSRHEHRHGALSMGLLHGAAGAAPVVALIPVVGIATPVASFAYLLLFSFGTVAGMGAYALVAGFVVGRAADRSARLARGLAGVAGTASIVIGCIWLLR